MFPFINIIPESPAWLFCVGKLNKLTNVLLKASKNNKILRANNLRVIYHGDERHRLPKKRPKLADILFESEIVGITYLTGLFALIFGSSYYSILAHVTKSQLANSLLAAATIIGMSAGQFCVLLMGHRKILQISIFLVLMSCFMLLIDFHDEKPLNTGPITTFLLINIGIVSLSYGVLLNYNTRTVPTLLRGTLSGIWRSTWALGVWIGNHDYVKFPTSTMSLVMTCVLAALFSLNLRDLYHRELPDTLSDSINFRR